MGKLVAKVKRWWKAGRPALPILAPYAVECACGQVVEGARQPAHQVVACPRCGGKVFVFPQSPLPPVLLPRSRPNTQLGPSLRGRPKARARTAVLALALVTLAGLLWLTLHKLTEPDQATGPTPSADVYLAEARTALAQGKFQTALHKLTRARSLAGLRALTRAGRRELDQLHRQAALMVDLLEVPLADVLRHASDTAPGEWQRVFRHRYWNKAVLLDAEASRNAGGGWELEYPLFVGDEPARVEIGDLDLLRDRSLDQPCRLIIGARLAEVGQEPSGAWVVHLQPDSGVLLTDRPTLEAACPPLKEDGQLDEVLQRQARWLADRP